MNTDQQIQAETDLIKQLETSYPPFDAKVGTYHPTNTPWHIHHTKVRDAYWRRRMLIAKRDGLNIDATAQVY